VGINYLARALTTKQFSFEQVLLSPPSGRDGFRRATRHALMRQKSFEHADRGRERRAHRTALRLTVPPAILELLAKQPRDHAINILIKVDAEHDSHTVDARLDFAGKERLLGMFPTAVISDERHCPANLLTMWIHSEVPQEQKAVCGSRPRLAVLTPEFIAVIGAKSPRGEQRTSVP